MTGLIIRESELGTRPRPPSPRAPRSRTIACRGSRIRRRASFPSRARPFTVSRRRRRPLFRGKQHFSARRTDGQTDSRGTAPLRRRRCRRRLERHCPRGFTRVRLREIPSFPVPPLPLPFLLPPSAPVNARALRFCRSGAAAQCTARRWRRRRRRRW